MVDVGVQEMVKWFDEWAISFDSEEELDLAYDTALGFQVRSFWVTVRC